MVGKYKRQGLWINNTMYTKYKHLSQTNKKKCDEIGENKGTCNQTNRERKQEQITMVFIPAEVKVYIFSEYRVCRHTYTLHNTTNPLFLEHFLIFTSWNFECLFSSGIFMWIVCSRANFNFRFFFLVMFPKLFNENRINES